MTGEAQREARAEPAAAGPGPATTPAAAGAAARASSWGSYLGLLVALAAMVALFSVLSERFFSYNTFSTIANQIPSLLVMSVGMTWVLIIAGIDLSVGSVLAVSGSVLGVAMLQWGWGAWPASLLAVAVGGLFGLLTGVISVAWRVPSFIVSLGVLEMARGLAYRLTDSRTAYIGTAASGLAATLAFDISWAFLLALAISIAAQVVLTRTVFGRYLVGIGTNEEAMRLAGVRTRPYKVAVFVFAGLMSGLAALFQVARLEAADPNAGIGAELQVIAAVVIGGTSLMGGRGSVLHTVLGVLIISVLDAGLAQVGASEPDKRIITGLVIVAAVILDTYRSLRAQRKRGG